MKTMKKRGNKRTITAAVLMAAMLVLGLVLGGCGSTDSGNSGDSSSGDGKETVSVALWGDQMMENYAPWLQEQFPDVNFDFYVAKNSADYYNYLAGQDALPDIMTVRRFALKDVEGLKDELIDLSDSELAYSFYQSYLSDYTYSDGTVNWLPASAELDDIIINKTLFEENNIEIPTDYESFVAACKAFEKLGITGFVTDMGFDYTCMETLQGLSASVITSTEGRKWRTEYESGSTNQLSEDVWLPIFEKLEDFIDVTGMGEDSLEWTTANEIGKAFDEGKLAMYRGGVLHMDLFGDEYEKIMIPYPGDTEEDSYYLTYPSFQVAAKKTDSEEREELILEIMTAMLSEEGLNHIAPGQSIISYNKEVEMNLEDSIGNLEPYINDNKIYIRLASSDMFSVSQTVVQKMITGELADAQSALDEFNRILKENETVEESPTVASIDSGYSRLFTAEHGNQAASAVYNTIREELGVDCVIGQSAFVSGDILAGDHTESELGYLVNCDASDLRKMNLTGEQLKEYVEYCLNLKETRSSVTNDYTLPVSSGFEMTITKSDDGYHVEKLTINGEDIDAGKTYTVVSWDGFASNYSDVVENSGITDFETLEDKPDAILKKRLVDEGGQLSEPTNYITLSEDSGE